MKFKKAKDNANKIMVFMISEFGEATLKIPAGSFITVPSKGVYDLLTDVVGDLSRFTDIEDFLQEGFQAEWFTTKDKAETALNLVCNVQNEYVDCEVIYTTLPVEVLYSTLKMKKAQDSIEANLVIEKVGTYLSNYATTVVSNKTFIFDVKWTKNQDAAILFDEEAANWVIKLLKENIKDSQLVKITEIEIAEPFEGVEMLVPILLINREKSYLYCEGQVCEKVEQSGDASWYTEDEYYKDWTNAKQEIFLNSFIAENPSVKSAELKPESIGLFDEDFIRYRKKDVNTKNKAQAKWEADHNG